MSTLFSHSHSTQTLTHKKLKSAALIITSTLLLTVSAHAAETKPTTAKTTINPTSINTSAINLAIMADIIRQAPINAPQTLPFLIFHKCSQLLAVV